MIGVDLQISEVIELIKSTIQLISAISVPFDLGVAIRLRQWTSVNEIQVVVDVAGLQVDFRK